PGKAIRRFVGTVTAVDGDRFQAGLRDPVTDEYRLADMELDQLLPHQAAALSAGTQFLWTLRQTDQWDARTRHSRIRILERAPLNIDQLRAAGAAITKERPARG
ncbi:MAG: hypothetical protein KDB26_14280, partial [Microthrixaceae bacterium]|nr:hypothetical protein [Microthrixaceae bacterium]